MFTGRRNRAALTLLVLGLLLVGSIAPAQAATSNSTSRPNPLTLHAVPSKITAGTSPSFNFAFNRPDWFKGRKELQRQFGPNHAWRQVLLLRRRTNTVQAPSLAMGKYHYRLAFFRDHKLLATSRWATVRSYANVALFRNFCGQYGTQCAGSEQVGNTTFNYTDTAAAGFYPYPYQWQVFYQRGTTCRSLNIQYAADSESQADGDTSYLELTQQTNAPVSAQTPAGTIGTMAVPLDGGPAYLDAMMSVPPGPIMHNVYIHLTLSGSCYTSTGVPLFQK